MALSTRSKSAARSKPYIQLMSKREVKIAAVECNTAQAFTRCDTYMNEYAYPLLANMAVVDIEVEDILRVLRLIWEAEKTSTGQRLRGYIRSIIAFGLDKAKVTPKANPARLKDNLDFY